MSIHMNTFIETWLCTNSISTYPPNAYIATYGCYRNHSKRRSIPVRNQSPAKVGLHIYFFSFSLQIFKSFLSLLTILRAHPSLIPTHYVLDFVKRRFKYLTTRL